MNRQKILITGGSGFVGTQVADKLITAGHSVTIVDRKIKNRYVLGELHEEDYLEFLNNRHYKYDTIIHLAAEHLVEQSVSEPEKYYTNNVIKLKLMLDRMLKLEIKNIIFSSSGNTYGRQGMMGALSENMYYDPENPYASTKVAGELLIRDYAKAYGMNYINFRYFNAAGADPYGRYGYVQRPATHVIPILCNKILKEEVFYINGNDYATKDGTCVRDYVHVDDLANAHLLATELFSTGKTVREAINLGGGNNGVSVKELCHYASEVVGKDVISEYMPRRAGDPAMLVADISKAKTILGWEPRYSIKETIEHAWNWERSYETSK